MAVKKDSSVSVGKIKILGFDPGNAYVKWVDVNGKVQRMPSYIGELKDDQQYKEELEKEESVVITYEGKRYVIGERAKQLNCPPMFKAGKQIRAHLMVFAVVAQYGFDVAVPIVENLRVLVEDNMSASWTPFKELLEGNQLKFEYRGDVWSVRFDKVTLVPEGLPPYMWAISNNKLKAPSRSQGIIDFGGGAMTARLISPGGRINWKLGLHRKGVNALAKDIAYRIQRENGISESLDESVVMLAMEAGLKHRREGFELAPGNNPFLYTHAGKDYYFDTIYDDEKVKWFSDLGNTLLRDVWFGEQIGEVLLVGGGAYHGEIMEEMTNGRFFIPKHDDYPQDFAQVINAYVLSNPVL